MSSQSLEFYKIAGPLTDITSYASICEELPSDIPALCKIIQNSTIHVYWAERMGFQADTFRQSEVQIRSSEKKLAKIFELDPSPLNTERSLEKRLVVNCRDITLLLTALLKGKGIPARARCGFATYFIKDHFEDHWICEHWDAAASRWKMVDAQLDDFQKSALKIDFDPYDLPVGRFIPAGRAWQMTRQNKADPNKFGIIKYKGEMFIVGNMQRDLLALNSIELLPWDQWGLMDKRYIQLTPRQLAFLDAMAVVTQLDDAGFDMTRKIFLENPFLKPHKSWLS